MKKAAIKENANASASISAPKIVVKNCKNKPENIDYINAKRQELLLNNTMRGKKIENI